MVNGENSIDVNFKCELLSLPIKGIYPSQYCLLFSFGYDSSRGQPEEAGAAHRLCDLCHPDHWCSTEVCEPPGCVLAKPAGTGIPKQASPGICL